MRSGLLVVAVLVTGFASASARAQADRATAALVLTEGIVYLNDKPLEVAGAAIGLPDSAVLRTTRGRAAIALTRGGWLFLDAGASVRVASNGADEVNRLEVLTGSAVVASATRAPVVECESEIRLSNAGLFRFDVQPVNAAGEHSCQFRVFDGAADVPLLTVTNALRAGQAMLCDLRCGDMVPTRTFALEQLDDFDQWARRTLERLRK